MTVSCLGEPCDSVNDCKGNPPGVICDGVCQCSPEYVPSQEGLCLERKYINYTDYDLLYPNMIYNVYIYMFTDSILAYACV